jgi:hypothetical protein
VLEWLLRLEIDCDRAWEGINGTDPSGEKDWCRVCPTVVVEPFEILTTEFERPEPAYWDGGGMGDGDIGEDTGLRLKRLLRWEEPLSAEAVMIGWAQWLQGRTIECRECGGKASAMAIH